MTPCSGWSFHKGTWNDALEQVRQRSPNLPVIVFCRSGGEQEWVEVLEAGGFDLLVPPYQKDTVLPVLEHAVVSHDARRCRQVLSQMLMHASYGG
jgi:DNA-binding NtrC family response regulator